MLEARRGPEAGCWVLRRRGNSPAGRGGDLGLSWGAGVLTVPEWGRGGAGPTRGVVSA